MKKLSFRIVLVCMGICTAIVILEIFFRIIRKQTVVGGLIPWYEFPCYEKGDYVYYRLKRNSDCALKSSRNAFDTHPVRTNSLGLRNRETPIDKPKDTIRILFLGDSFTMGVGVKEEEVYPRLIEKKLKHLFPDKNIEVINAGVNGTGPLYQYIYLKKDGIKLNPDIIVVGFFPWNDITSDLYQAEEITKRDSLGNPDSVDSKLTIVDNMGSLRSKDLPGWFYIPPVRSSFILSTLANKIFPLKETSLTQLPPDVLFCVYKRTCKELDKPILTAYETIMQMQRIAVERGARLLYLMIPANFEIYYTAEFTDEIPFLLPTEIRLMHKDFSLFFQNNAIDYLDLYPTLIENTDNKSYFENDPHWTPAGHELAAEAISKKLSEYLRGK